jgi:hypothetical protein
MCNKQVRGLIFCVIIVVFIFFYYVYVTEM